MNTLPPQQQVEESVLRDSARTFRPINPDTGQPVPATDRHVAPHQQPAFESVSNQQKTAVQSRVALQSPTSKWLRRGLPLTILGVVGIVVAYFVLSDLLRRNEITAGNAVFAQGEQLLQKREASAALTVYQSFLETYRQHPLSGLARRRMVFISDSLLDKMSAEKLTTEASGNEAPEVERLLRKARTAIAEGKIGTGDRQAQKYLAAVFEIDPANFPAAQIENQLLVSMEDSAATLHGAGNLVAARRLYRQMLKIDPKHQFAQKGLDAIRSEIERKQQAAANARPFSFQQKPVEKDKAATIDSSIIAQTIQSTTPPVTRSEAVLSDNNLPDTVAVEDTLQDASTKLISESRPPRPKRNKRKISLIESALNPDLFPEPEPELPPGDRTFDELGTAWYRFRYFLSQDVDIFKQTPKSLLIYRGNRRNYLVITRDYTPESHIYSALEQKRGGNPYEVWVVNRQVLDGKRMSDENWRAFFRPEFVDALRYSE